MKEKFLQLLSYPRSFIATLFTFAVTAVLGSMVVISGLILGSRARKLHDWIIWTWARLTCWSFSIDIEVEGLENLHPHGVLFLFNHTSHFDIVVFHAAITKSTRFGAKIELFKIPIFGQSMKASGVLPITRSERDRVLKLYEESIERVHKGESFILAAEGTRHEGPGVGEKFKSGPFIFAINGQFPIQPVVIKGTHQILPRWRWLPAWGRWHNPVRVQVLPAVSTAGYQVDDRERLKETVREMMTKAYAGS